MFSRIHLYIIREITSLFLLGLAVFTMILLMGRLIRLTELVVSHGVPVGDVSRMILYLMPSFLVFTIPMAFLLAVLLAFGRLSSDNEITVLKACGISLRQLMPPVLLCGVCAALLTLAASTVGMSRGNSAFKELSVRVLKQNLAATIREKVFWDDVPGIVMYADRYDEISRSLRGIIIYDMRDQSRPLTIFAESGSLGAPAGGALFRLSLRNGSIHSAGGRGEYRLISFGEYAMSMGTSGEDSGVSRNELDMGISELLGGIERQTTPRPIRLKMQAELHSRFAFPFACIVFAVIAVPLGIENRRSGRSAGYATSIALLLCYYLMQSLARTLAERGALPPLFALWATNALFLGCGWYLLVRASQERGPLFPSFRGLFRRRHQETVL